MSRLTARTRHTLISTSLTFVLIFMVISSASGYLLQVPQHAHAQPVQLMFNHFLSTHYNDDSQFDDNGPASLAASAAQEQYDDRAYPYGAIDYNQATKAYGAFQSITHRLNPMALRSHTWHLVGPIVGSVPKQVTYTGSTTTVSGRVTAIAVSDSCTQDVCRVWVGAAGGGIWVTSNGLAPVPQWQPASNGIASNAIGSIAIDPNDSTGATLYVGTGEENGSSDHDVCRP